MLEQNAAGQNTSKTSILTPLTVTRVPKCKYASRSEIVLQCIEKIVLLSPQTAVQDPEWHHGHIRLLYCIRMNLAFIIQCCRKCQLAVVLNTSISFYLYTPSWETISPLWVFFCFVFSKNTKITESCKEFKVSDNKSLQLVKTFKRVNWWCCIYPHSYKQCLD